MLRQVISAELRLCLGLCDVELDTPGLHTQRHETKGAGKNAPRLFLLDRLLLRILHCLLIFLLLMLLVLLPTLLVAVVHRLALRADELRFLLAAVLTRGRLG